MADLKRCDACHTIWDPAETTTTYGSGYDANCCSVSIFAPNDPNNNRRDRYSQSFEVCQDCAREVIKLVEGIEDRAFKK